MRVSKTLLTFLLSVLLSVNNSTAQLYTGNGFSIIYPLSPVASIDYSTYANATNCGYISSDWANSKVIKVGPGIVTVTLINPVNSISFDFGALDDGNNETITFTGVNSNGVVTLSSPNAGSFGCLKFSGNTVKATTGWSSNGKLHVVSTLPFTELTFSVTGPYSVIKVDNFSLWPVTVAAPIVSIKQDCGDAIGIISIDNPSPGFIYSFDSGATFQASPISPPLPSNTYFVMMKESNNFSAAVRAVVAPPLTCDIFFPNSFTPNGDGRNDDFGPLGYLNSITNYNISIYNNLGEIIFHSTNPFDKWNGTYRGKILAPNSFTWHAAYTKDQVQIIQRGNIIIIR